MIADPRTAVPGWRRRRGEAAVSWARNYGIVLVLVALCIVFAVSTSNFLSVRNFQNLAQQCAQPGLIACGMTVVIIAGEFDLSVGAIFGFAAVVTATVANHAGVLPAVLAGVGAGAGLGVANGLIVTRMNIQSFLATLATQFVIVGIAIYLTAGTDDYRVTNYASFLPFADGQFLGIERMAWITLGGFIVIWLLLRVTRFGRQIYAVGGNRAAARISGVRVRYVVTAAFAISGTMAALAGVLAASDNGVAQADGGLGTELTAIAAVIIGGTSVAGGRGGVWRTLVAVVLLAVVADGFTLLYISPTWDQLVQGAIILLAILIDTRLKEKTGAV
jgi:ribose transport system permease protein